VIRINTKIWKSVSCLWDISSLRDYKNLFTISWVIGGGAKNKWCPYQIFKKEVHSLHRRRRGFKIGAQSSRRKNILGWPNILCCARSCGEQHKIGSTIKLEAPAKLRGQSKTLQLWTEHESQRRCWGSQRHNFVTPIWHKTTIRCWKVLMYMHSFICNNTAWRTDKSAISWLCRAC